MKRARIIDFILVKASTVVGEGEKCSYIELQEDYGTTFRLRLDELVQLADFIPHNPVAVDSTIL